MSLALHTQKSWPRQVEGISWAARDPKAEVCVDPKYKCLFFWLFLWSALFALIIPCLDTTSPNSSVSFADGDTENEASNIPVPLSPSLFSLLLLQCQPASYQRRTTTLLSHFISYFIASGVTGSNLKESLYCRDHDFYIEITAAPRTLRRLSLRCWPYTPLAAQRTTPWWSQRKTFPSLV